MKIALVDDHLLLTEALRNLLLSMSEVEDVTTFSSAEAFLKNDVSKAPDIMIMDFMVGGISGMQLLEICRRSYARHMKIIVLSSFTDVQTIKNAIRSGANGFLSKSTSLKDLQEAITQINGGKQYIGKNVRESLINSVFTDERDVLHLSPREKEVLQKVCGGLTIKEIATALKLSAHTVQYYHRSVMDKFKVKRTSDLIVYAMQNGLYAPEIKPNRD